MTKEQAELKIEELRNELAKLHKIVQNIDEEEKRLLAVDFEQNVVGKYFVYNEENTIYSEKDEEDLEKVYMKVLSNKDGILSVLCIGNTPYSENYVQTAIVYQPAYQFQKELIDGPYQGTTKEITEETFKNETSSFVEQIEESLTHLKK